MRVAVVFGGPSVEHDVSIITGQQVVAALGEHHDVVPVYVAQDGHWWTGAELRDVSAFAEQPPRGATPLELRLGGTPGFVEPAKGRLSRDRTVPIDVVLNCIHGTGGEDGKLLGALELAGIPYAGRGVAGSAVAMDKHLAKVVLKASGLAVLPHHRIERSSWEGDTDSVVESALRDLGERLVVKPATLGSSVGVTPSSGRQELSDALELAFELDRQALIEPWVERGVELNVAVLGRPGGELVVSEVERPLGGPAGLSFEDKYMRGAAKGKSAKGVGDGSKAGGMAAQGRVIPADVSDEVRVGVQDSALSAHRALRLAGVARYDFFLLDDETLILNEPNTVPGSYAFYLFEPVGVSFTELLDRLVHIALAEHREERLTTRTFDSALLQLHVGSA